ncbi:MAG: hypothetical protein CBB68_15450 [Rhodospirillaceae bacterium TMED8]|nr:hypothetical protein [Magnetovibrio sp.]OUT47817.1 MAG: hypothetical protein CBB68_15450 [Rhodospirillaceae bacterium TMED8]|tara:strand:- start:5378 stop:5881 length:504 start_codon:yes stop_codon:yes gene_type:complete
MLKNIVLIATCLTLFTSTGQTSDKLGLVSFEVMTIETALKLAQGTLSDCRKKGYQVAVAVVDRFGNLQVTLRDRFAGGHTPETARRKAWTAVNFRTDTLTLSKDTKIGTPAAGVRFINDALMVGGGVPVQSGGSVVGAIGVSGAPGGPRDDECARVGIETITDLLEF